MKNQTWKQIKKYKDIINNGTLANEKRKQDKIFTSHDTSVQ